MPDILLCNRSLPAHSLSAQCGIQLDDLSAISDHKPVMMAANTPYLAGNDPQGRGRSILCQLAAAPVSRQLTRLSLSYGGDNVVALAEISAGLREYNVGLMGAATSVYANRIGGFAGAVKDYQQALLDYRQAVETHSPQKAVRKQKAHVAFQKMQTQFQHELRTVTYKNTSRRGTPLTSAERATNIARSSRTVAKLHVADQIQASKLVTLSRHARFMGNGLAVINFGGRVGNVHNSYRAGGNWERDLFIESSSFALSVGAGAVTVKAGAAALGFLVVATPIGWVGLVVGGLAVAGGAAAASITMNSIVKDKSGGFYDDIVRQVSTL